MELKVQVQDSQQADNALQDFVQDKLKHSEQEKDKNLHQDHVLLHA